MSNHGSIKEIFLSNINNNLNSNPNSSNNSIDKKSIFSLSDKYTFKEIYLAMLYATLSSLFYAFNTIIIKLTSIWSPNYTAYNFLWWRGVTSTIFLYFYMKKNNPNLKLFDWQAITRKIWFGVRVIGFYIGFIFFSNSLLLIRVSTVQVLANLAPVFALIISVFLNGEKLYIRYLIGILLCFLGSFIILGSEKGNTKNENFDLYKLVLGSIFALINAIISGFVNVSQKIMGDCGMTNKQQVFYISLVLIIASFFFCLFQNNFGMDLVIFFMGTLNGVNFFYANHFYQEALPVLNVGGCVPFNYLLVIFVFILCVVVLGEHIYFTDIIGSLVIISFHAYNAWVPIQNEK